MFRKLILTVALAALYDGEPAQLGGSLLTIFIFLVLHMLLKPYLNPGKRNPQKSVPRDMMCIDTL